MAFDIRVEILSPDIARILFGNGTPAAPRAGKIRIGSDPAVLANVAYGNFYSFDATITGLSELVFECQVGTETSGSRKVYPSDGFTGNDVVNGDSADITWATPFAAGEGKLLYDTDAQYDQSAIATLLSPNSFRAHLSGLATPAIYHFSCLAKPAGVALNSDRDLFIASPDATFSTQTLPVSDVTATANPIEFPRSASTLITVRVLQGNPPNSAPAVGRQVVFGPFPGSNPLPGRFDPNIASLTDANGETSVTFYPDRPGTIHLEVNCEGRTARVTIKAKN